MEKKEEKNAEEQGEGDEELYCRKLVSRASEGIRNLAQMHRNFFFSWMLKTMSKCRCMNSFFIFSPFYTLDLRDYHGIKAKQFLYFQKENKNPFLL